MDSRFLGLIPYSSALASQADVLATVHAAALPGVILGFEALPVVTLGIRALGTDLLISRAELLARGFSVVAVDRGGQATLHNPGQLVIFPVCNMRAIGARSWVEGLAEVTRQCLLVFGIESHWQVRQPGLHTARGKIMACGVRLKRGVSTHGIAINVSNELADFSLIRACGIQNAPIDKMGDGLNPREVFDVWCNKFRVHWG
jgi:lipoyl(octanoyl) transferase